MDTVLVDEIKAGNLAIKHVIRGFDAIHLAAALELRNVGEKPVLRRTKRVETAVVGLSTPER